MSERFLSRWERVIKATPSMHNRIADEVPQVKRGRVWCLRCGHTEEVNGAHCLRNGWPLHCGETMSIDKPRRAESSSRPPGPKAMTERDELPSTEAIEAAGKKFETAVALAIGLHFCRGNPPHGIDDLRQAFVDVVQDGIAELGLDLSRPALPSSGEVAKALEELLAATEVWQPRGNNAARNLAARVNARAALASTEARAGSGWKLVPVEPTKEMVAAWPRHNHGAGHERAIYSAMLAAAPSPAAPSLTTTGDEMSTSVTQLREWFDRGLEQKAAYMVIVCDTFDWDDYPVFCTTKDEAQSKVSNPGSMQKVMEVYDLSADKEAQLKGGTRVWAL